MAKQRSCRSIWVAVALTLVVGGVGLTFIIRNRDRVDQIEPACDLTTLAARLAAADLVVTGQVFMVLPSATGADVIIDPLVVYQGDLPAIIRIVAADAAVVDRAGRTDRSELRFASDQPPYLLFLRRRPDGRYDTSDCAGSRLLGAGLTAAETAALGAGRTAVNR